MLLPSTYVKESKNQITQNRLHICNKLVFLNYLTLFVKDMHFL